MKKWTEEELQEHIRVNTEDYNAMVIIAALYRKLYGKYPKIGLSGMQGECADRVVEMAPDPH